MRQNLITLARTHEYIVRTRIQNTDTRPRGRVTCHDEQRCHITAFSQRAHRIDGLLIQLSGIVHDYIIYILRNIKRVALRLLIIQNMFMLEGGEQALVLLCID